MITAAYHMVTSVNMWPIQTRVHLFMLRFYANFFLPIMYILRPVKFHSRIGGPANNRQNNRKNRRGLGRIIDLPQLVALFSL